MKEIRIGEFKTDARSKYLYLGAATVKQARVQRTEEPTVWLLDLLFETSLSSGERVNFLLRLETNPEDIRCIPEIVREAIATPVLHPDSDDLFDKAVTGATPREQWERLAAKSEIGHRT